MPVSLQILIGCLPIVIMAVVIVLRTKNYVLPGILAALVVAATVFGLVRFDLGQTSGTSSGITVAEATKEQLLYLSQYETAAGNYDFAEELLDMLYRNFGDDAGAALQMARLRVLDGDLTAAVVLYEKACALDSGLDVITEEASYYALAGEGEIISYFDAAVEQAQVEYLESQGLDPEEYGFSLSVDELAEMTDMLAAFQESVTEYSAADAESSSCKKKVKESAAAIIEAYETLDSLAEEYSGTDGLSSEDAASLSEAMASVADYIGEVPGMAEIAKIDEAIVGGYQMAGDAEGLVSYAQTTGSAVAYAALADLYVQGGITEDALSEISPELTGEEYLALAEECEKTAAKISYDTSQEEANVEEQVESVRRYASNLALCSLETGIQAESRPIENQSRLYLVKSMVNFELGNTDKGEEYLTEALRTAPYCDDSTYASCMEMISANMNGTASGEDIKNVSDYLTEAYQLAFPVWSEYTGEESESTVSQETAASQVSTVSQETAASQVSTVSQVNTDSQQESTQETAVSLTVLSASVGDQGSADEGAEEEASSAAEDADAGTYQTDLNGGISSDFLTSAISYVNTAKARISISSVNASNFPEISIRLQSTWEISLTNPQIILSDCNLEIEYYSIEEVPYEGARVALVCDNSGSMTDSIEALREAVRKYIDDMGDGEQVSIVAFDDSMRFQSDFSDDQSVLADYVDRLEADGGTNIYSGLGNALLSLKTNANVYRALILLTDGIDDSVSEQRLTEINETCEQYGITLYVIGLGESVETEYLTNIALAGNGQFIYCSDISQLDSLYAFIHSQMQNSYDITYTAQNLEESNRTVSVENTDDGGYAEQSYWYFITEPEEDDAKITSIDTHSIYKKETTATFRVLGENFTKDMKISVSISGNLGRYVLEAEYLNEGQIQVTIPEEVPIGTYTLTATANNSIYTDEIELFSQYEELTFGAYKFKAQHITKSDSGATLTGDVTMNDFLHFYGSVSLVGDLENGLSVILYTSLGSYVEATEEVSGLVDAFYGNTIVLPVLTDVTLFNDGDHLTDLDNYKVQSFFCDEFDGAFLSLTNCSVCLYPHMLTIQSEDVAFDSKCMTGLIDLTDDDSKSSSKDDDDDKPKETKLSAKKDQTALIVPEGFRSAGSVSASFSGDLDLLKVPCYLSSFSFSYNTFNHDYSVSMEVTTQKLLTKYISSANKEEESYGFSLKIKGGYLDELMFKANLEITIHETPKIVVSDFQLGLTGMAPSTSDSDGEGSDSESSLGDEQDTSFIQKILGYTITGSCDIGFPKIKDQVPPAESLFGDLSLFKLDDCTVKLRFSKFSLQFEGTALLMKVEIGAIKLKVGNFTYTNFLLGISDEGMTGLYASVTAGPSISYGKFNLSAQAELELTVSTTYFGVWLSGVIDYDITFIDRISNTIRGDALLAVYNKQFVILLKGSLYSSDTQVGVRITIASEGNDLTFY